ncbi:MAG: hypothetical protein OEZ24_07140 [Candidatus Bathyarchaeota archaeon]|nr:hypothetical protein [Candidatus Bathyarchaeota archaeon]
MCVHPKRVALEFESDETIFRREACDKTMMGLEGLAPAKPVRFTVAEPGETRRGLAGFSP